MKEYLNDLLTWIVVVFGGIACLLEGFSPNQSNIPIVIAFLGIMGLIGVGFILLGLLKLKITLCKIFQKLKSKKVIA